MIQSILTLISKKKIQHFLYVHVAFLLGLLLADISIFNFLVSTLFFLCFLAPLFSVMVHNKFNHNYIDFKHPAIEWAGLWLMVIYSFWKFQDLKNYHIFHHQQWLTPNDPTATEIRQGWLKYYVGCTDPCNIPVTNAQENYRVQFMNRYFYLIKFISYALILLAVGFTGFWFIVLLMQFYFFVYFKIHDIIFHNNDLANDKPYLFLIYFTDSWHITHHSNYHQIDQWRYPVINPQFWMYKLLFKPI